MSAPSKVQSPRGWLAAAAGAGLLAAASCSLVNAPQDAQPSLTGGAGGGATGGGANSGGGGADTCSPSDCPGLDTTCRFRTCEPPNICGFLNAPEGTACTDDEGQVCDGDGACVECVTEAQCDSGDACSESQCVPATCINGTLDDGETDVDCGGPLCAPCANGDECTVYSDCLSHFCNSSAQPSVCAACSTDAECSDAGDAWCDPSTDGGSCLPQKVDGDVCDEANECLSGFCPDDDGLCCEALCDATCQACVQGKTGAANGTCSFVTADLDPDIECADEGAASCGVNGTGCTGTATECNRYPSGSECVAASCTSGQETTVGTCNNLGNCTGSQVNDCDPYVCNSGGTACLSTCSGDPDCSGSATCQGTECVPPCVPMIAAYMPGYATTTQVDFTVWQELEDNWASYGTCTVSVIDIAPGFSLASLIGTGATTLVFGYPGFATAHTYSSAETQAVVDFLENGHGGLVASWLINFTNNQALGAQLAPRLGVSWAALTSVNSPASITANVLLPAHPVATGLPASFNHLTHPYAQGLTGSWSAALLAGAQIVLDPSDGSSPVIAYDGPAARGVYFAGFAEWRATGAARAQILYNALAWTSLP